MDSAPHPTGVRTGDKAPPSSSKAILWLGPPWLKAEGEGGRGVGREGRRGLELIQF